MSAAAEAGCCCCCCWIAGALNAGITERRRLLAGRTAQLVATSQTDLQHCINVGLTFASRPPFNLLRHPLSDDVAIVTTNCSSSSSSSIMQTYCSYSCIRVRTVGCYILCRNGRCQPNSHIIGPHRTHSMHRGGILLYVSLSVCLCVSHDREPCTNG